MYLLPMHDGIMTTEAQNVNHEYCATLAPLAMSVS